MAIAASPILLDALLAKVGREGISLSDLIRYQDTVQILQCAELRKNTEAKTAGIDANDRSSFAAILSQYIEEELIYTEARSRKNFSGGLAQAIQTIQQKPACLKQWQELGKKYGKLFATQNRNREGETLLVRELEKRLTVDRYSKEKIPGDRSIWVREARVRIPVKIFLD